MLRFALAFLGLVAVAPAFAAPPENADPKLRDWFESLRQPYTGAPCCSISDCRRTEARHNHKGWEVLIDERFGARGVEWVDVPSHRVLERQNPIGEAVVCFIPTVGVMCFVPPPET
jgi:hypothetical protein